LTDHDTFLEKTWSALLSRDRVEVLRAYRALDPQSRQVVLHHLTKMATETGWHPEQALSAQSALEAIKSEEPG
jgi:Lon protease-like protein